MKRILFLADINSAHTQKWVGSLAERGFVIGIFSLQNPNNDWYSEYKNVFILNESDISFIKFHESIIKKSIYLKFLPKLKKVIKEFNPDILHAHYATSYGLLGRLSNFHPFIISCWGSDIYDFPRKSILYQFILKHNLLKADMIFSTSNSMAKEITKYTDKKIEVTPFGINLKEFAPKTVQSIFNKNDIVIGIIKSLEKEYGIDYLLKSFSLLKKKYASLPLKLLIVGDGSLMNDLKHLANDINIGSSTFFAGKIPQKKSN
ncbi:MAG: glycosyltransferase [Bacteroidota bacterium]